jgi:hypothetical protein
MLGSGAAEPVAVCDTAVPLKLHGNEIDKIAIAEGAKRLDEDLMTLSSQIQDDYAVLVPYGTTHIFNSYLPKTRCVVCFCEGFRMPAP